MKRIALVLLLAATAARATVVGMVHASPQNKVKLEVYLKNGDPYLVVKQWSRDCPITFTPGIFLEPKFLRKTLDGEVFLTLSLFDSYPQTKKCVANREPSRREYNLAEMMRSPILEDGRDLFFKEDKELVLVLCEFPPKAYDARLAAGITKLKDITEKPKTIYESKFEEGPKP